MSTKCRSIWISDIHLGTKGCQADELIKFLSEYECDYLYLVGDIIDGWRMRNGTTYWPQTHTNVLRKFLGKAKHGTQVVYVSGNHDEFLRPFVREFDLRMGNLTITDEAFHKTIDGRNLLVIHGDKYDTIVKYHKWIAFLGDSAYTFSLWANRIFNGIRKKFGLPYWSLSSFLKHKVKHAQFFIEEFEEALAHEGRERKVDGIICGHIHHAEIRQIQDIMYYNSGDWVESCTALIEDYHGNITVKKWLDR